MMVSEMAVSLNYTNLKLMKRFYNRKTELNQLKEIERRSNLSAQFTVITGRRRIGKTQLILKAFEKKNVLYFFVARKSEVLLCKDFQNQMFQKLNIPILGEVSSFAVLFEYIIQLSKTKNITLIIDEFQEFFSINPSVYSDMQRIWDLFHKQGKLNLIVCGSVISLMHKIFQNNKEPLFGRAQHFLQLKPFDTQTLKTILKDYHPAYKYDDLLALYCFTGGVAKYVQLLLENKAYTREKMISCLTAENSIFLQEGKNMLIEEFGKDYGIYFSILSCIAEGKNSRSELENTLNKEIGGYLSKMEADYHLIRRYTPVFAETNNRQMKYVMEDNFLIFWFRFMYKYSHIIEIGALNQLKAIIIRDYETFSGLMLERYFKTKAIESQSFTRIGGFWDRKGELEIDFIAINETEKKMRVAEIKRNKSKIRIPQLQQKMQRVMELYPNLGDYQIRYYGWGLEDM
jgi:AAA+ ATPase superfamily predicted ATPase